MESLERKAIEDRAGWSNREKRDPFLREMSRRSVYAHKIQADYDVIGFDDFAIRRLHIDASLGAFLLWREDDEGFVGSEGVLENLIGSL